MNFASISEYSASRKQESKERCLKVPRSGIVRYMASYINTILSSTENSVGVQSSGNSTRGHHKFNDNSDVDNDLDDANQK
jgi:hypothetical protein